MRLRLASRNEHKLRELRDALPGWNLELLEADEFPPEGAESYYDNALRKARYGQTIAPPGEWVLGEDSGLEVDALGGGPGVASARFAPEGNFVERLLAELEGVDEQGRGARYVCELVCVSPELEEFRATGALDGTIAAAPDGSEGFGYDPIFVPDGESATVARLGNSWKQRNSHRTRAARALRAAVDQARPAASS